MSEQIQIRKQIPRQRHYEYEQPFPAPEIDETELDDSTEIRLELIDETLEEST